MIKTFFTSILILTGIMNVDPVTSPPQKAKPEPINTILQSTDQGETWEDISNSLPEIDPIEDFFAGESDLFLRDKNELYRSKSNLKTHVWIKEKTLGPGTSIAFTRSGVIAFTNDGRFLKHIPRTDTWLPVYTNFKNESVRAVFETSTGAVLVGCDDGLYKSADKGRSWRQVLRDAWVMDVVESEGVLLGRSQLGIIRSTDNGEHWETVISDGGVGIAVEVIDGGFAAISCCGSALSRTIRISLDHGKSWQAIDEQLRPSLFTSSIKQIGKYLICGHPDGIFRSSDMGKTWSYVHARFGFFGEQKGFKIYTSGGVLYAVANNSGC